MEEIFEYLDGDYTFLAWVKTRSSLSELALYQHNDTNVVVGIEWSPEQCLELSSEFVGCEQVATFEYGEIVMNDFSKVKAVDFRQNLNAVVGEAYQNI